MSVAPVDLHSFLQDWSKKLLDYLFNNKFAPLARADMSLIIQNLSWICRSLESCSFFWEFRFLQRKQLYEIFGTNTSFAKTNFRKPNIPSYGEILRSSSAARFWRRIRKWQIYWISLRHLCGLFKPIRRPSWSSWSNEAFKENERNSSLPKKNRVGSSRFVQNKEHRVLETPGWSKNTDPFGITVGPMFFRVS